MTLSELRLIRQLVTLDGYDMIDEKFLRDKEQSLFILDREIKLKTMDPRMNDLNGNEIRDTN